MKNSEKLKTCVMHLRCAVGSGGGPEKTILLSSKFLDKKNFRMVVVYLRKSRDPNFRIGERAKQRNIVYHEVEDRKQIDFIALRHIRRLLVRYDIKILHTHEYKSDVWGWFLKKNCHPMKLVSTTHGWGSATTLRKKIYTCIGKRVIKEFDHIIVVNQDQKSHLEDKGIPQEKLTLIQNAIDAEDFMRRDSLETIHQELGLNRNQFLIGAVGRLSQEKDLRTLIKAADIVRRKNNYARFILVGEGPEEEALRKYCRELGISNWFTFTGQRMDIKKIYQSLDTLVLTSRSEGLPNVILEALAMEVPVIAANIVGVKEVIRNEVDGLLFKPGDYSGIASRICLLMTNRNLKNRLVKNGRETVCTSFTFDQRMRKVEDVYRKVMKENPCNRIP